MEIIVSSNFFSQKEPRSRLRTCHSDPKSPSPGELDGALGRLVRSVARCGSRDFRRLDECDEPAEERGGGPGPEMSLSVGDRKRSITGVKSQLEAGFDIGEDLSEAKWHRA